jgi:hypothetical protein
VVSVTDVSEIPQLVIESSYTVEENTTTVATASYTGYDGTVMYQLSGTDASAFTFGGTSGVIAFQNSPDYENPTDADSNNVYNITVTVSNESGSDSADVAVTVTDVDEGSNSSDASDLFISEYAEGSSNNKYLEQVKKYPLMVMHYQVLEMLQQLMELTSIGMMEFFQQILL